MDHLVKAIQIYEQNDTDFSEILKWHLANGVVVSMRDCFMFGFFSRRSNPTECVTLDEADCVFVTLCVGDMHLAGKQIVELVPWIAYERELKGDKRIRITNFKNFYKKLKWAV